MSLLVAVESALYAIVLVLPMALVVIALALIAPVLTAHMVIALC